MAGIGWALSGQTIERPGHTVCGLHRACGDEEHGFLVEPQNQCLRFVSGLASKSMGRFVSDLASKPPGRFVSGLTSKPLGWFLSVWPQNR
jgi:hypothetical protein